MLKIKLGCSKKTTENCTSFEQTTYAGMFFFNLYIFSFFSLECLPFRVVAYRVYCFIPCLSSGMMKRDVQQALHHPYLMVLSRISHHHNHKQREIGIMRKAI